MGVAMEERPTRLGVQVEAAPDAEPEEIAEATLQLRREIEELDVEAVEVPKAGQAPAGTRGAEVAALGALAVTVANSQLLGPVLAAIRSWLAGSPQRTVKLELDGDVLELSGISAADQRRLTEEWLRRHQSR
jgi:hypothetical protein